MRKHILTRLRLLPLLLSMSQLNKLTVRFVGALRHSQRRFGTSSYLRCGHSWISALTRLGALKLRESRA